MAVDVTLELLFADAWTADEERAIDAMLDRWKALRAQAAADVRQPGRLAVTELDANDPHDRSATVSFDGAIIGTVVNRPLYDLTYPWQGSRPNGPLLLAETAVRAAQMLAAEVLVARAYEASDQGSPCCS